MATRLMELFSYETEDRKFFAKIEGDNPTGSMKDRMAEYVIKKLEGEGKLQKGITIVEASSGNTGIALAKIGMDIGYKVIICMSKSISSKKKELIANYGARVMEFDTSFDPEAGIKAARELGQKSGYYFFNQFENTYHVEAYSQTLGVEVVNQLMDLSITIDVLVAGVGTGGSLIGLAKKLKSEHNPNLKIYAVGPLQDPTKIGGLHPRQSRGEFAIWKNRGSTIEDGYFYIDDEQAIKHAIDLNKREMLSVGPSSGAVLATALNYAHMKGNHLLLFADSGDRYLELYSRFKNS